MAPVAPPFPTLMPTIITLHVCFPASVSAQLLGFWCVCVSVCVDEISFHVCFHQPALVPTVKLCFPALANRIVQRLYSVYKRLASHFGYDLLQI